MRVTEQSGVTLYSFESPAFESVTTFVTTRHNPDGCANRNGNFNLGLYCGDDNVRVEANLQQLCTALGIQRDMLYYPHQVHGKDILVVDEAFTALPHAEQLAALDGVDAIITHVPGIAIAVTTADCVPVVLYDAEHHAVAAIHAGWRGTAQEIVRHTIDRMKQLYGTDSAHLQAGIAPCIGVEAYEVGNEVVDALRSTGFDINSITIRNYSTGKMHIDLAAANADLLLRCGVELDHIEVCGICTYRNSRDFYSVRALGSETGRFLTGIML